MFFLLVRLISALMNETAVFSCAMRLIDVLLFLGFQKWDDQLCFYTLRVVQR